MKRNNAVGKKIKHVKTGAIAKITDVGSWKHVKWIWIRLNNVKFGEVIGGPQCAGAKSFWEILNKNWIEL